MPALTATDYLRHNPLRIYLHIEGSRKSKTHNQQLTRSWFEPKICHPATIFQRFKGLGLLVLRMHMFNDIKQHYKVISTIWTKNCWTQAFSCITI